MPNSGDFNPNSNDAVLSRILQRMDAQDAQLARIEKGVNHTNERVNGLERDRWYQRGMVAAIGVVIAAAWDYFKR